MTGSTHPNHRSARSPRPTPEGSATDNPIAGPRTGTTRSEPSAPASAGASGRHNEPGSRPASTCPTQPPSKARGASPQGGERHHGVGREDPSTESDRTEQCATHHAGPPGRPDRHAAGHKQGTRTGAKQQRPPGAGDPGRAHNTQQTTPQEEVPGNTKPTHHKPQAGVAGYKRSAHTGTHTAQHPSQELPGTAETRAQAHTFTPHTPARSGGVRGERARKRTHTPLPQPGAAGHRPNPSPSTHAHTAHPSPQWRGTSGARTQAHTHPETPARSGGAQAKPEPQNTHPDRTPQPGVVGYMRSAQANAQTPPHPSRGLAGHSQNLSPSTHRRTVHPSQEWRGRSGARRRAHTQPNTAASSGGAQPKPEPKHAHQHSKPQPGVAG